MHGELRGQRSPPHASVPRPGRTPLPAPRSRRPRWRRPGELGGPPARRDGMANIGGFLAMNAARRGRARVEGFPPRGPALRWRRWRWGEPRSPPALPAELPRATPRPWAAISPPGGRRFSNMLRGAAGQPGRALSRAGGRGAGIARGSAGAQQARPDELVPAFPRRTTPATSTTRGVDEHQGPARPARGLATSATPAPPGGVGRRRGAPCAGRARARATAPDPVGREARRGRGGAPSRG